MSHRNRGILFSVAMFWTGMSAAQEAPLSVEGAVTVTTEKAQELFQDGATFVDVRTRQKWQWGHILGAHHFDLRSTFGLLKHPGFIEKDQPVVIYSNGSHTMSAALATFMAASWGYENVYYYRDGYFSWLATDLPVDSSKERSSLEAAIMQSYPGERK